MWMGPTMADAWLCAKRFHAKLKLSDSERWMRVVFLWHMHRQKWRGVARTHAPTVVGSIWALDVVTTRMMVSSTMADAWLDSVDGSYREILIKVETLGSPN